MAWLRKKADPISSRARVLNNEIAALEAQIKKLDEKLQRQQAQPKTPAATLTAEPPRTAVSPRFSTPPYSSPAPARRAEPIFEPVDLGRLQQQSESQTTPEHFNELGVRKYDLPALLRRIKDQFQGPSTTNPKLVSYLAAGGIQGLRPLRYEKRVARNRFILLVVFLFVVLLGLLLVFVRR